MEPEVTNGPLAANANTPFLAFNSRPFRELGVSYQGANRPFFWPPELAPDLVFKENRERRLRALRLSLFYYVNRNPC